jgi:hypothetical protein
VTTLENILENSIISALQKYIDKQGIKQNVLAERLSWSAQDLNDTLQRRKSIGKNRQAHIKEKLGKIYEEFLIRELAQILKNEFADYEGILESVFGKPAGFEVAEPLDKYGESLSPDEKEYAEKLVSVLRKKDKGTVTAVKQTIDTFLKIPDMS